MTRGASGSELDGGTTSSDGEPVPHRSSPGPIRTLTAAGNIVDVNTAREQARALLVAADGSPLRQYRYELRRRGIEWKRAADLLGEADEGDAAIELAGSVTPGMKVPCSEGWGSVIRQLTRDGQLTLHVEDAMGRPLYLNYVGPSSPVVVKW